VIVRGARTQGVFVGTEVMMRVTRGGGVLTSPTVDQRQIVTITARGDTESAEKWLICRKGKVRNPDGNS
jgi:hypothetical protein